MAYSLSRLIFFRSSFRKLKLNTVRPGGVETQEILMVNRAVYESIYRCDELDILSHLHVAMFSNYILIVLNYSKYPSSMLWLPLCVGWENWVYGIVSKFEKSNKMFIFRALIRMYIILKIEISHISVWCQLW